MLIQIRPWKYRLWQVRSALLMLRLVISCKARLYQVR